MKVLLPLQSLSPLGDSVGGSQPFWSHRVGGGPVPPVRPRSPSAPQVTARWECDPTALLKSLWGSPIPSGLTGVGSAVPYGVLLLSAPQMTAGEGRGRAAPLKSPWEGPSPSDDSGGPSPSILTKGGREFCPLRGDPAWSRGPSAPHVTATVGGGPNPSGESMDGNPSPPGWSRCPRAPSAPHGGRGAGPLSSRRGSRASRTCAPRSAHARGSPAPPTGLPEPAKAARAHWLPLSRPPRVMGVAMATGQ